MKNQKGFSLIELLIVVVIIGIIAAIAIPNLLASRRAANEGSAVSSMRTVHGANSTFFATKGRSKTYATAVKDLTDQQLIDASLAGAIGDGEAGTTAKSGYVFNYALGGPVNADATNEYSLTANPESKTGVTATGTRDFQVNQTGVIGDRDSDPGTDDFVPVG